MLPLLATTLSVTSLGSAQAATIQDCQILNDPIVDMNDGNVTGIRDLQICFREGERIFLDTYNVNFTLGSFNNLFGNPNDEGFDTSCKIGVENSLCFWGEGGSHTSNAVIATQIMNQAINAMSMSAMSMSNGIPMASEIQDEEFVPPIPNYPNIREFYLIPHAYSPINNEIVSERGRYNGSLESPWTGDRQVVNNPSSAQMYAGFELTQREEVVEEAVNVPESSNLVGIVVAGLSLLVFTQSHKS